VNLPSAQPVHPPPIPGPGHRTFCISFFPLGQPLSGPAPTILRPKSIRPHPPSPRAASARPFSSLNAAAAPPSFSPLPAPPSICFSYSAPRPRPAAAPPTVSTIPTRRQPRDHVAVEATSTAMTRHRAVSLCHWRQLPRLHRCQGLLLWCQRRRPCTKASREGVLLAHNYLPSPRCCRHQLRTTYAAAVHGPPVNIQVSPYGPD
jgi:hypothetical protein